MHCIKTINIEYEYGTTRLFLLAGLTFIVVFCLSYALTSLTYDSWHSDRYFFLFVLGFLFVYPIHKGIHYFTLFQYKKSLSLRLKIEFSFIPILKMRIQEIIPKNRYIISLIAPFIVLNTLFIVGAVLLPVYGHYFCLLLSFHCSICILDLLSIKNIWRAPKQAVIEETPRGYEVLVPQ